MNSDRKKEAAHGGIVSRNGNIVNLGDGARWWLVDEPWARNEVDAIIARRTEVRRTR